MHNGKQNPALNQVLLIEGHLQIRNPLEQVLMARGHRVTAVASAELGLNAVDNGNFDTVICNHQLPGISGMDFFSRSSTLLHGKNTILTATFADNYLVNDALAAGIQVYLEMPFKIENLIACVEGRYQDIYAGSLGRHLYVTSGGQIMAVSSDGLNKKPVSDALKRPLQKPIHLRGRQWKLYLNPDTP
ncbi:MAG: response regulator [Desulfobacteraceae bacterium]